MFPIAVVVHPCYWKFHVHGCQEVVRRELRWLVQVLFLLESLHTLWILGLLQEMYILGILVWREEERILQNHRPRPEWSYSSYQLLPCARTMRVRKLSQVDWFCTVIQSSEDILAGSVLGAHTRECTSCELTLFSILYPWSFLPRLVHYHSGLDWKLHTNLRLLLRNWADLRSEWFGIRVLC